MRFKNVSDYIIALIVIGCSTVLLAAMGSALSGEKIKGERVVYIDLPSATGLRVHSAIRYAGAPAGKILKIEPLPWDQRVAPDFYPIRITARINPDIPEFKTDSIAAITSDTILAEKFIDVSPGSHVAQPLKKDQAMLSKPSASFDSLTSEGLEVIQSINAVLNQIRREHPDLPSKLSDLVADASNLAQNADALMGDLNQLVGGNKEGLGESLANLKIIMANLKVISTYTKSLTGTLSRRPWRIVWGGPTPSMPEEDTILKSSEPLKIEIPEQ